MSRIAFLYLTIDTPNKSIDYLIKKNSNIYIHNRGENIVKIILTKHWIAI
jgi:hypothetical protein